MFMDLNLVDGVKLLRRAVKYLVEGLMVAIAAYAIPKILNMEEVLLIALSAAAILASSTPTFEMAVSARSGAGFGKGANLVGFPVCKFNSI